MILLPRNSRIRARALETAAMARCAATQRADEVQTDAAAAAGWIGWSRTKSDGDFVELAVGIIDRTLLNARCAARLGLIRSYL